MPLGIFERWWIKNRLELHTSTKLALISITLECVLYLAWIVQIYSEPVWYYASQQLEIHF